MYRSRSLLRGGRASVDGVARILEAARRVNPTLGVTGVLFFDGAHFLQTLEGPPKAVGKLYASIARDPRHEDLMLVDQAPIESRSFSAWAMAFVGRRDGSAFRIPSGFLSEIVAGGGTKAGAVLESMVYFLHDG